MPGKHTVICIECGDTFKVTPSRLETAKWCSHLCQKTYLRNHPEEHPNRNGALVSCDACGTMLYRTPSKLKRNEYHFCDTGCYIKWRSENIRGPRHPNWKGGMQVVECANCGNSLERPWWDVKHRSKRFFCNVECGAEWRSAHIVGENHPNWNSVVLNCAYCGKEVIKERHRLDIVENHFCDNECRGAWMHETGVAAGENNHFWQGGPIQEPRYYGPNWHRQRRKARRRDSYSCQRCDATEKKQKRELDVHHIIPFRQLGLKNYKKANKLSNLISLCRHCHGIVEYGSAEIQPYLI